jgi:hypothetical protein
VALHTHTHKCIHTHALSGCTGVSTQQNSMYMLDLQLLLPANFALAVQLTSTQLTSMIW